MKLNKKKVKGQWFEYDYEGTKLEFFIKPFSAFLLGTTPMDESGTLNETTIMKIIKYSVTEWKNIFDEEEEPLECTDDNKIALCEAIPEIFTFIIEKSQLLREEILIKEEELKN